MEENQSETKSKKGNGGRIVAVIVGVVMLLGGSLLGTLFGSKLLGGGAVAEAAPANASELEEDPKHKIVSVEFEPIVMDLRDANEGLHHLKVGLAVELADKQTPDDFHAVMPRGRQAVLSYLRALPFEEVSKPDRFETIREEISNAVIKAVGERRVSRVLLIDFVAQ